MTAERGPDGHAIVRAQIINTGAALWICPAP